MSEKATMTESAGLDGFPMVRVAYLRRRAKHYVQPFGSRALCGFEIPDRPRWRIKIPEGDRAIFATCYECRECLANWPRVRKGQ